MNINNFAQSTKIFWKKISSVHLIMLHPFGFIPAHNFTRSYQSPVTFMLGRLSDLQVNFDVADEQNDEWKRSRYDQLLPGIAKNYVRRIFH